MRMAARWPRLLVVLVGCGSVMVVPVVPRLMAPVVSVAPRGCSVMVAPVVRAWPVVLVVPAVLVAGGWVLVVTAAPVVSWVAMVVPVVPGPGLCMASAVMVVMVVMAWPAWLGRLARRA